MSIENLLRVVPPPERPGDPFLGSWRKVEAKLGTALPADYKAFVRRYGSGTFMDYLWIWTPGAYHRHARLEHEALSVLKLLREDEDFSFPLWPAADGLLPFGVTHDGDYLAWVTRGSPDEWRVTVLDRGSLYEEALAYDCDLTDFLARFAAGQIYPELFEFGALDGEKLFIADHRPSAPTIEMSWRIGCFGGAGEGRSVCRLGRP